MDDDHHHHHVHKHEHFGEGEHNHNHKNDSHVHETHWDEAVYRDKQREFWTQLNNFNQKYNRFYDEFRDLDLVISDIKVMNEYLIDAEKKDKELFEAVNDPKSTINTNDTFD